MTATSVWVAASSIWQAPDPYRAGGNGQADVSSFPHKKILASHRAIVNNINANCSHSLIQNDVSIKSWQHPAHPPANGGAQRKTPRPMLAGLLKQMREIEIDHEGKIYRLRLTQANKLILIA